MTAGKSTNLYWLSAKIAIALGLFLLLVNQVHLKNIGDVVARLSLPWFTAFLACFICTLLLSSFRYWVMTGRPITFLHFLRVVILQNSLSIFVATGAGMISYVSVLKTQHKIKLSRGIASLLFAKIGDFIYYLVFLILAALVVYDKISAIGTFLIDAIIAGLVVFLLLLFSYLGRKQILIEIEKLVQDRRMSFWRIPWLTSATTQLQALSISKSEFVSFFINTFLLNTVTLLSFYCTMRMFSVVVGIPCVFFINSIIQFISMIPIQVFGGLGVCDVPSMYLYSLFGVSRSEIASVLVLSRVLMYAIYALLFLSLITIRSNKRAVEEDRIPD